MDCTTGSISIHTRTRHARTHIRSHTDTHARTLNTSSQDRDTFQSGGDNWYCQWPGYSDLECFPNCEIEALYPPTMACVIVHGCKARSVERTVRSWVWYHLSVSSSWPSLWCLSIALLYLRRDATAFLKSCWPNSSRGQKINALFVFGRRLSILLLHSREMRQIKYLALH